MNNPILKTATVLALVAILAGSCGRKDLESPISSPTTSQSPMTRAIALSGRVLDEQQVPVSGAMVRSGMQATSTDADGRFLFNEIQVNPNGALIEVKKQGFFHHTQLIEIGNSTGFQADISLKEYAGDYYINSSSGAILNDGNGALLTIEANTLIDKVTNSIYSGQALVHFRWLPPGLQQGHTALPFSSLGTDQSGEKVIIDPYTALMLEISGTNGSSLDILPGKVIQLSLPIPSSLSASSPNSVPIWQYDASKGIWIKKGIANKNGTSYSTTITGLSNTSVGAPLPLSRVTGTIRTSQGGALAMGRYLVRSASENGKTWWEGRTDNDGRMAASLPANQELLLEILNDCGERIGIQNIRTLSTTTSLPAIAVPFEGNRTISLAGKVSNCKNAPVSNGWVEILVDGKSYRAAINNGNYAIAINRCNANPVRALVIATNSDGNMKSEGYSVVLRPGNNELTDLSTCMAIGPQYVNYAISSNSFMNYSPEDSISSNRSSFKNITQIYAASNRDELTRKLSFQFEGPAKPGQYGVNSLEISHQNLVYVQDGKALVTITAFGAVGEEIEGKISGRAKRVDNGQSLPFSIEFKVQRRN
ncbi:carboxypeptidase-like regulatory domain-containing protein [Flavihumibacter rivuli]|uniref:carboxypeptidase-like regulatory domain-containing protein n=1 Tax=Flavihumibacter rivuli TaxID=2838156 RepID=UPI001BDEA99C|nr:carboxypeptidase-like regulatory domain-containing protein [Flavihumibacter rivuli]ULQ57928.1 carboxypeptidase-like regulatory domain-containing protein [Flavihumibacter rivuli]